MERELLVGSHIKYVDQVGISHDALVTVWWGKTCCNLLFVVSDPQKTDMYGRQSEHVTSVVHKERQEAPGFYWTWPDEL